MGKRNRQRLRQRERATWEVADALDAFRRGDGRYREMLVRLAGADGAGSVRMHAALDAGDPNGEVRDT